MFHLESMTPDEFRIFVLQVALVMARMVAFFRVAPIFGSRAVPGNVRTALIFSMAMIAQPLLPAESSLTTGDALTFAGLFAKEFFVGFIFGMFVWLPLRGIEYAGVLIDTQRGSTMAQDMDIIFNAQTTPTARLLSQTMTMYFFAVGGFLMIARLLFESYVAWPIFEFFPSADVSTAILFLQVAGKLLLVSVIFALPASIFMFLVDIGIAYIAKAAPTLNALVFGMPVKSTVAIVMLFSYMQLAFPAALEHFDKTIPMVEWLLRDDR